MTEIKKIGYRVTVSAEKAYQTAAPGSLLIDIQKQLAQLNAMRKFGDAGRRKYHTVTTPVDPEYKKRYDEFAERWDALIDEGEEANFFSWDGDSGGPLLKWLQPTVERVYDETKEEYAARLKQLEEGN